MSAVKSQNRIKGQIEVGQKENAERELGKMGSEASAVPVQPEFTYEGELAAAKKDENSMALHLQNIRDKELFAADYKTFKEFLRAEFNRSAGWLTQKLAEVAVKAHMAGAKIVVAKPLTMSEAYPLAALLAHPENLKKVLLAANKGSMKERGKRIVVFVANEKKALGIGRKGGRRPKPDSDNSLKFEVVLSGDFGSDNYHNLTQQEVSKLLVELSKKPLGMGGEIKVSLSAAAQQPEAI